MSLRTKHLCLGTRTAHSVRDLLEELARARGCSSAAEIEEFLAPLPTIRNPLARFPGLDHAIERVDRAIRNGECITIFGDYDCDGVTSVAQFVWLFRRMNFKNFRVYIPDRFLEDYGLTIDAVTKCIAEHNPKLVIAVDCGSTAIESIAFLKSQGIDTIVLDHHQVHDCANHPAYAHLNPKAIPDYASSPVLRDAATLSAAGLVFFFCEIFASKTQAGWDREAALILAGLGSYCDMMPLTLTNRALVKGSLHLANSRALRKVPGLFQLVAASGMGTRTITDQTYGFVLGPAINATGRLAHAKASLNLLCAQRDDTGLERAKALVEANQERKDVQTRIMKEATAQAERIVAAAPESKILVLYSKDWHTGVVGIVAGRIKEAYHRPTIVLARLDNGVWKGSGRSVPAVNIGELAKRAVEAGVLLSGGGHLMACGVKLEDGQLTRFAEWCRNEGSQLTADLSPELEIIGKVGWLNADGWNEFFSAAAPFGQGNPRPHLLLEESRMKWGPVPATKRGTAEVWAMKASYQVQNVGEIFVTWTDIERARDVLSPDRKPRLVLDFSRTESAEGRVYDNFRVIDANS